MDARREVFALGLIALDPASGAGVDRGRRVFRMETR